MRTATPLHEFGISSYPRMLSMTAGGNLQTGGAYEHPERWSCTYST